MKQSRTSRALGVALAALALGGGAFLAPAAAAHHNDGGGARSRTEIAISADGGTVVASAGGGSGNTVVARPGASVSVGNGGRVTRSARGGTIVFGDIRD